MNTMLEKRRSLVKNKKGFTLIELIVVIVIIGILAAVLIPRMTGFTKKAQGTEALVHAKQVATAYDSLAAEKPGNSYTDINENDVRDLANVPNTTTITLKSDGGFTVSAGGIEAGRATSGAIVK